MALTMTRNPNLSFAEASVGLQPENIFNEFGETWFTGLKPQDCRGFDRERGCLTSLPLLNLRICTRQDVLDYFNNTWTLTELLFAGLRTEAAFIRPPYHQLRHPMIFYYGHPAVLFVNKLRLVGFFKDSVDLYLEKVLETGVDEMSWDDLSKNEMNWPTVKAVHSYRKRVYSLVDDFISTHPDLDKIGANRFAHETSLWALWMGLEHEKIHFETSSVLIRELPIELVQRPIHWPPLHPSHRENNGFGSKPRVEKDYELTPWTSFKGGEVTIGKPKDAESYGWDNEYGTRIVKLKDFQFTKYQITNGEFFEFVSSGSYGADEHWSPEGLAWRKFRNTKRPTFWAAVGPEGSHEYCLRTLFEFIPIPWSWPAEVNFHEAVACCNWKRMVDKTSLSYRLFSEAEFVALRKSPHDEILQTESFSSSKDSVPLLANFNAQWSSPRSGDAEIFGNLWTWLDDQFNPLPDFEAHPLYDDFSEPCFDGKHQMMLGGSFLSCGHEASKWARFHFRPHFYQHSGFRIAATLDGSKGNGAFKIIENSLYVHKPRENAINQMGKEEWWKDFDQPLELSSSQTEVLFNNVRQHVLSWNEQLPELSPMGLAHDTTINSIPEKFQLSYHSTKNFPERGESFDKLTEFIFKEMAPLSQLPGHPGYLAYVAGSGNMISNLAQLVAQTLNPFTGHYMMAPGLVTLEAEAIQWFQTLMGFDPKKGSGYFTTGTSLATWHAFTMARALHVKGYDYSKYTLYVSEESHHCLAKAWVLAGFDGANIRFIDVAKPKFRMDLKSLRTAIEQDKQKGLIPLCIVASAGSTNTGAVDQINEIANISEEFKTWFHIDGAYGALFLLTEKGKELLSGTHRADSLSLDLHKAMGLSYGTGCLLVKDKANMRSVYPGSKSYMPPEVEDSDDSLRVDYADITPELSRDYRGLRVWLPIKAWGISPFILNLEEKLHLTRWLVSELKKIENIEIVNDPDLTIVAVTLNFGKNLEENNKLTKKLFHHINQESPLFISSCIVDSKFCMRFCLLGFKLHYEFLKKAIEPLKEYVFELRRGNV